MLDLLVFDTLASPTPHSRAKLRKSAAIEDDAVPATSSITSTSEHALRLSCSFDEATRSTLLDSRSSHGFDMNRVSSFPPAGALLGIASMQQGSRSLSTSALVPPLAPSAFSAVDVPRLMVHSPVDRRTSPSPLPTSDGHLLTVPSPDPSRILQLPYSDSAFGRSPDSAARSPLGDLAAGADVLASMSSLQSAVLGLNALGVNWNQPRVSIQQASPRFQDSGESSISISMEEASGSLDYDNPHLSSHLSQIASGAQMATPELMAQMPPKSAIQENVRSGGGRFQLVRKRGRSEVWNLFGQVLDTATGVRLPYVACYACKVLYTDTGGGTGNMTRHRCPIGTSYRSGMLSSSSETTEHCPTSSSLESSAPRASPRRRERVDRTPSPDRDRKPLLVNIHESSSSVTPQVSLTSGEVCVGGVDRDMLADSIVRAVALDMVSFDLFQSAGFRQLCERLLLMGRRFSSVPPSELLPDPTTLEQTMVSMVGMAKDETHSELKTPAPVCISIEKLTYKGEWKVVWACKLSTDWKLKQMVLGVHSSTLSDREVIVKSLNDYGFSIDKIEMITIGLEERINNIRNIPDMSQVLEEIIIESLGDENVDLLQKLEDIYEKVVHSGRQLPAGFPTSINQQRICRWFLVAEHLRAFHEPLTVVLAGTTLQREIQDIERESAGHLASFLSPFYDSIRELSTPCTPTFHLVVPEWTALRHACLTDEEDDVAPMVKQLRHRAVQIMEERTDTVIQPEHRMATVLNHKTIGKLSMLFTDAQISETLRRIREVCHIHVMRIEKSESGGSGGDGEPSRKRRAFLSRLEADSSAEDELDSYSRSQFPQRDLLSFWCELGQAQFPRLAVLARTLLPAPATRLRTSADLSTCTVPVHQLANALVLRSSLENESE